jgi:hypothetical protein
VDRPPAVAVLLHDATTPLIYWPGMFVANICTALPHPLGSSTSPHSQSAADFQIATRVGILKENSKSWYSGILGIEER